MCRTVAVHAVALLHFPPLPAATHLSEILIGNLPFFTFFKKIVVADVRLRDAGEEEKSKCTAKGLMVHVNICHDTHTCIHTQAHAHAGRLT